MKIVHTQGDAKLAKVFVAEFEGVKSPVEFVWAKDTKLSIEEKFVVIVSNQFGCSINCPFCDAGIEFKGNLSSSQIFKQIDFAIADAGFDPKRCSKFKVQFARMGEPAFNPAILDVIDDLQEKYNAKKLIPCISTVAPRSQNKWFERLLEIRNKYSEFQLQFSIHSTSQKIRDYLIPVPKWSLKEISDYGNLFINGDRRKASLNFALSDDAEFDCDEIAKKFNPNKFCVKITPVNPTNSSNKNMIKSEIIDECTPRVDSIMTKLKKSGFDVILSIGDLMENEIGSNCGMIVKKFK